MLREYLKYQGTIYLSENYLQDVIKEDGATKSWIKTGGIAYKREEEEEEDILIFKSLERTRKGKSIRTVTKQH